MAYESPIFIFERVTRSATKEIEDSIVRTISLHYGVTINKEELKKALLYDRQQYDKGYEDALAEVREIIKDILVSPTPHNRPIKDTRRQAVYDAMYEIEKLVRRYGE